MIPVLNEGQSLLDYPGDNTEVLDMEVFNGRLLLGGDFMSVAGMEALHLATWNGQRLNHSSNCSQQLKLT